MNELRKFLFGNGGGLRFKPLCQECVRNCISNEKGTGFSFLTSQKFITEKLSNRLKSSAKSLCTKIDVLTQLFSKQCNVVIAQRIRRSYQILLLYRNLYGEHLLKEKVSAQFNKIRKKPLVALLSASIFNWDQERVSDEEIQRCKKEIDEVHKLVLNRQLQNENLGLPVEEEWEQIVDKEHFKVWRHQIPNSLLYKYRVLGHFQDIPARAFYNTQVDVTYWKDWDKQTMDVSIVDSDPSTDSEVIHWLYKFPYPMYPREYVYVRRCSVDQETKTMVITARATNHPKCPKNNSSVRIETYSSQMVITPDAGFDENGFTYIMSYYDDPQTNFPPMCYNWMASAGVHEFLERLHRAALTKVEKSSEVTSSRIDNATLDNSTPILTGMVHQ